jgi:rRNA maturation endonuclease Nob1
MSTIRIDRGYGFEMDVVDDAFLAGEREKAIERASMHRCPGCGELVDREDEMCLRCGQCLAEEAAYEVAKLRVSE